MPRYTALPQYISAVLSGALRSVAADTTAT